MINPNKAVYVEYRLASHSFDPIMYTSISFPGRKIVKTPQLMKRTWGILYEIIHRDEQCIYPPVLQPITSSELTIKAKFHRVKSLRQLSNGSPGIAVLRWKPFLSATLFPSRANHQRAAGKTSCSRNAESQMNLPLPQIPPPHEGVSTFASLRVT